MADNVSISTEELTNLTSQMNDFSKAIEKANAKLLRGKNTADEMENVTKECNKLAEKQEKQYKKNSVELEHSLDLWKNTKDLITSIGGQLGNITSFIFKGGIIAGVATIVADSMKLDDLATKLSAQLGNAAGVTKKDLAGAVNSLQANLGTSYQNAADLVKTLGEKRYTDNIYEAAGGIDLFSRATGVSRDSMAQLSSELNKGAGMSTKSINSMYAGMMKVQQSMGLSAEGMTAVTTQIQKAATNMAAFGKSSTDIKKMAVETTALVSAMEKVGVAAGDATELVDRLTDPDRIEDNILLYSQLGVSMEDAMSGNVDLSNMDTQLKEMSQKIVDMGPIAGAQFAKQMGMSYKEASKMAKMEGGEVDKVADAASVQEDAALETMKKLQDATEGISEKAQSFLNKLEGKIRQTPKWLLAAGAIALLSLKKLISNAWNNFKARMSGEKEYSAITEGVGSSIAQGTIKGAEVAKAKIAKFGDILWNGLTYPLNHALKDTEGQIDDLYNKAIKKDFASAFYASAKQRSTEFAKEAETAANSTIESLQKKQADLMKQLSNLGKDKKVKINDGGNMLVGVSGKDDSASKQVLAIQEAYNKINEELKLQEAIKEKLALKDAESRGFTKEAFVAFNKINKTQETYQSKIENINSLQSERSKIADELVNLQIKEKDASGDAKKIIELQIKAKQKELEQNKKILGTALGINEIAIATLSEENLQIKAGEALRGINQANIDLGKEKEKLEKEATKNMEDQIKLGHSLGKIWSGIGQNIKNAAKQKFQSTTFGAAFTKVRNAGGSKGQAASAGAKAAGKKAGGAVAKGLGNITKMLGPMAIVMALIGKVMDKIKEPLEEIMDQLVTCLQPIIDVLISILGPALKSIITALLPPILRATATIIKILGFILKPIVAILRGLSNLKFLGGAAKAMGAVADTLEAVTGDQMTDALNAAADKIENGGMDIKKAADKQEEIAEEQEAKPAEFKARGGELVQVSAATSGSSANGQVSSTTQTVSDDSSTQADKEAQKIEEKKEKKERKIERENTQKFMEALIGTNLDGTGGVLGAIVNWCNKPSSVEGFGQQKSSISGLSGQF